MEQLMAKAPRDSSKAVNSGTLLIVFLVVELVLYLLVSAAVDFLPVGENKRILIVGGVMLALFAIPVVLAIRSERNLNKKR